MAKLEELAAQLEAAETVDEINGIKSEIESEKARLAAVEEKGKILESLKGAKSVEPKREAPARTLGEYAEKNLDLSAMRAGSSKSAATGYGFKAATDVHMSTPVEVVDQNVVDIARSADISSLFGAESISGTALKYFVMGATEGAPTSVAEGAQKPQFHVPYTPKTATLQKIAGWYYETDELIEDNAFLKSSIDNRGLMALADASETYLLTELTQTSGVINVAQAPTADNIFSAIMDIKSASNFDADAIIINPADYKTFRLAKDGGNSGQYYGGGYFYGPYGNGEIAKQPGLWGLNTIITTAVPAGSVIVGAFKRGASVITKAGEGARVEIVTGDHDDRTNNRVTVVVEERLALAVRVPSAFALIKAATTPGTGN